MTHEWKIGDWCELRRQRFLVYRVEEQTKTFWAIPKTGGQQEIFCDFDDCDVKRLDGCDSWDWQPPKPIEPPEGYRLLVEGDEIRNGDLFLFANEWRPVTKSLEGFFVEGRHVPHARKIEPPEVGEGYRIIDITKDTPKDGDEFWSECEVKWLLRPYTIAFDGIRNNQFTYYRRKIEPKYRPMTRAEFLAAWKQRNFCPLISKDGIVESVQSVLAEDDCDTQLFYLGSSGWNALSDLASFRFASDDSPLTVEE